jgi:Geranylgeranyl pyrophosphate synthase
MIDKEQIVKPVALEFEEFKTGFSKVLHSDIPLLQSAIEQVLHTNGKNLRPILLLLTAKACGEPGSTTIDSAIIMEILHTSTLIHDDVVDDTKQRRGVPSLNAIFDNRISVLTGDYILAGTILRAAETENVAIIKLIAKVCRELSEGELMQLDNAAKYSIIEDDYFNVIKKKTATLISACAEIGATSVNASPDMINKCRMFGQYLGFCFQIKDDIFDYYENVELGKPTGNDIREGKITLPLLYAINNATPKEFAFHMNIIEKQDFTHDNISALINFAKQAGGITYAEQKLAENKQLAIDIINSLPESDARQSLLQLADYIAERTK